MITDTKVLDTGNYSCIAENKGASTNFTTTFNVTGTSVVIALLESSVYISRQMIFQLSMIKNILLKFHLNCSDIELLKTAGRWPKLSIQMFHDTYI